MPRIAIVGCGGMGRHHAGVITKKLGHKIAAACDEFPAARERFQADFPGTETYADLRTMLDKARPDAVWICLPTYLHKNATLVCAQAKVHVMLEKPMSLISSECREMDEAARKAGIKLMLAFCRRFDNHWGTLKSLLVDKQVIGRPIVWRHMAGGGSPGAWFTQKDQGGGPFIDGCVHNWDFCLWTFGPAASVKSSLLTLGKGTSLDTGVVDVVFGKGDRTTMMWSWGLPPGARAAHAHDVLGSGGALHFGVPNEHRPKDFNPDKQDGFHVIRGKDEIEAFTFEKNDMYEAEDRHFLECVASGKDPVPGAAEGLAATALAERAWADSERKGS